ncbi:helix-turn-helix domain-containing protein [Microbacterium sp.]|uniref:helix-turn-helix domain-containing protein n=1 Tax=Microbacterium sp. TaxID=51671 RepID=UPI003A914386
MLGVLESVRRTRGFTQTDLAAASGVSQATISLIETEQQDAPQNVRDALAHALRVPSGLLEASAPAVQIRHLPKGSVRRSAIRRVTSEFALAFVHVGLLAGNVRLDVAHRALDDDLASARAMGLRRKWVVSPGPVDDVIGIVEAHGIICLDRDLGGLRSVAIAATSDDGRALMFIDPRADADTAGWAVAHELGHLALHESSEAADEASADEFAGEFLAPRSELRALLEAGTDIDGVIQKYRMTPPDFASHARSVITVAAYRRLRTIPSMDSSRLPGSRRLAEAVHQRIRASGESIDDVASSAFLSTRALTSDYLDHSQS